MSFQEDFPTITKPKFRSQFTLDSQHYTFHECDVEECCLDKQKVKDVINIVLDADYYGRHSRPISKQHYNEIKIAILKELKLE